MTDLDTICQQLDSIRNELRALAREQRRAGADREFTKEIADDCDKLTEVADHIATFVAPFLK